MDPASLFEDALKGLATKDLSDPKPDPFHAKVTKRPGVTLVEPTVTAQPKRSPLITDSPIMNTATTANTSVLQDSGGDIILSALINAGIAPSTLSTETSTPVPVTPIRQPVSPAVAPNLKVVSAKGNTVFKIVPKSSLSPLVTNQLKQPLRMASQLIRRLNSDNGINFPPGSSRVPNIIRKRPPSYVDSLIQPASKLRKSSSNLSHFEAQNLRTSNALFPSTPAAPTSLHNWYDNLKISKGLVPSRNPPNSGTPLNFVKPYQFFKRDEDLEEDEDLAQAETYADYVPLKLKLGCKHPDPVVESSSLSSVSPPDVHYKLILPDEVIERGYVSALQLEAVVYACQRHECILPNGQRAGFLIGDGAGVGKGRTIAGILYENYLRHRKKAIWLSVSNDLKVDAERDLRDIGLGKIKVHSLNKFKYARISGKANGRVKKGVIFSTYSSLIGESQGSAKAKYKTRLKQLVHWCGKKFDGLIVFDECHRAKNLTPSGSQKPTKTGLTVLELQNRLPNARIVYASATGATEPRNMAYMTRLGLWGEGTPFKTFNSLIQTLERRGVGAMELVAMDMKLRGMYIARQLSFQGVSFRIWEVAIEDVRLKNESFINVYNQCADLWVYAYRFFSESIRLICPSDRYRKTMWGQFWSAHQRFFKYLCISAKLDACVDLTKAAIKEGNCVVIGLQSTGEAKTLEQVEEFGSDLGDFVSTTKGVFQSLVEKYFPTPSNIENFNQRGDKLATIGDRSSSTTLSRAGRAVAGGQGSGLGLKDILGDKMFAKLVAGGSLSGSVAEDEYGKTKPSEKTSPDSDDDDDNDHSDDSGDDDSDDIASKPNGTVHSSSSDYYDSDLELNPETAAPHRRSKKSAAKKTTAIAKRKQRQDGSSSEFSDNSNEDWDPDALFDSFLARQNSWSRNNTDKQKRTAFGSLLDDFAGEDSMRELSQKYLFRRNTDRDNNDDVGMSTLSNRDDARKVSKEEAERQCKEMQSILLRFIEKLGAKLPPSSLDELIDKLGGPSHVAEMTGRKGRMVVSEDGRVSYESRREFDVSLEILNLTEKQRFMDGEKLIAIISEAASSGISLQADRRAVNQRRRVHITLELPWSADRAIQQFGRTHRSNQVSAPKYIFLISDLAGEQRFASTVAKRLESLGALTHGDRRATDTRDLSQFNLDTKLGREALDIIMRACINGEEGIVEPPAYYSSTEEDQAEQQKALSSDDNAYRFFVDVKASLQGVGLATGRTRERDSNQMSKFLNRILGLRVHIQNALFRYFSDTLEELTRRAKRDNRLDLGILDLGTSGQNLEIVWTKSFDTWFLSESTKVHLHKVTAERGLSWAAAMEIYTQHDGVHDGFYLPSTPTGSKVVVPVLAVYVRSRPAARLSGDKTDTKFYRIYRPNTGMQARPVELEKLLERYSRVSIPSDCQDSWHRVCKESATRCIHMMQHGFCPRVAQQRTVCEVGLRVRTYYVLSGSVLNVWAQIEPLIYGRANSNRCMQVVRLRSKDGNRIIGSLIPPECVDDVLHCLSSPPELGSPNPVSSTDMPKGNRNNNFISHVSRNQALSRDSRVHWPSRSATNSFPSQKSWQFPHRPYAHYSRGASQGGRGYQSSLGLRASQQPMRPRDHTSSYPCRRAYTTMRHDTPMYHRGAPLNSHFVPVASSRSHEGALFSNTDVKQPLSGTDYPLRRFPSNLSTGVSVPFSQPWLSQQGHTDQSSSEQLAQKRIGSRLNAALSIPLDTSLRPALGYEQSSAHQPGTLQSSSLVSSSSGQTISYTPQNGMSSFNSEPRLTNTTAITKRVPGKMTKFKIKWKEG
ncbi:uncharacterized protein DEA37_0003007 [Paragonimus westermani]|uniref:Protein strawberry notch n=1 Tax=Paragonimus westermani TaxID=34504 RepID=A0A5J4NH50_9TREM|nr:uncharacterized protein DEA37_0003007 [Paragonimus westermani]